MREVEPTGREQKIEENGRRVVMNVGKMNKKEWRLKVNFSY